MKKDFITTLALGLTIGLVLSGCSSKGDETDGNLTPTEITSTIDDTTTPFPTSIVTPETTPS